MEKIIIFSLALMIGSWTFGNYNTDKPQLIRHKADKSLKKTDKPHIIIYTYVIKDMDPH
jgi:hypothetical protein